MAPSSPARRAAFPFLILLIFFVSTTQAVRRSLRRAPAESPSHAAEIFFSTFAKDHYSQREITEIEEHDANSSPRNLIAQGQDADRGDFRWMTALISPSGSGYYQFCGSSLIHEM